MKVLRQTKLLCFVLFASLPSCAWLNTQKTPASTVQTQELDYFTINFARQDKQPITQMTVGETWSSAAPGTNAYPLSSSQVAIRKMGDGEKVFFTVDFGPDFDIAQIEVDSVSAATGTCGPGQYLLKMHLSTSQQYECAPGSNSIDTINGQNGAILATF